jgi:translation initiation factor IF-3
VLVIDETGQKVGIMLTKDAIKLAEERSLDLVEVGGNADPPVTKIMDYGKFVYQKHKQEKESKKKGVGQKSIKEIKFGIKTEEHDLQTKINHIMGFLEDGHKTKVIVMYRGREMAHPELGRELATRVIAEIAHLGAPEYNPKQEGYNLVTIVTPHSKQMLDKIKKQKEAEAKANAAGGSAPPAKPKPAAAQTPAAAPAQPPANKEENKVG